MNEIPTVGRRPTLDEVLAYYARVDIATALYEAARRWAVVFVTPVRPRWEPDWKRDRLSPNSPREMADLLTARIRAAAAPVTADGRLAFYPSLHRRLIRYSIDRVDENAAAQGRELFWEADAENWRDSFDAILPILDALYAHGVRVRLKYSGNRSLHLTVPLPGSGIRSTGDDPGEIQRRISRIVDRSIRNEGGMRPHSPSLIRLEYSLNEDTGLVSVPIPPDHLAEFSPWEAGIHHVHARAEKGIEWPDRIDCGSMEPSAPSSIPPVRFESARGSSTTERICARDEREPSLRQAIESAGGYRAWANGRGDYERARGLWTVFSKEQSVDTEVLTEALRDGATEVRWAAVHFADALPLQESVPLLLDSVGLDPLLTGTVLDQFRRMGPSVTGPLLDIVKAHPDSKPAAGFQRPPSFSSKATAVQKALSIFYRSAGTMTADDALREITSGLPLLQARAAVALRRYGERRHVAPLVTAFNQAPEDDRRFLIEALPSLTEKDPRGVVSEIGILARKAGFPVLRPLAAACSARDDRVLREAVVLLRSIYGERVNAEVEALLASSELSAIRAGALRIYAGRGGEAMTARLIRIIEQDESDEVRGAALVELARLDPEQGLRVSSGLVRTTRKALRLKATAVYQECRRRCPDPGPPAETVTPAAPRPTVPRTKVEPAGQPPATVADGTPADTELDRAMRRGRELADAALEQMPKMLRRLGEVERQTPWILAYGLDRLSERSGDEAEARIAALAAHKEEAIRALVARALGLRELGDPSAALARLSSLAVDRRSTVRAGAAEGIGEIDGVGEPARFLLLESLARDKHPDVRRGVAKGLGCCGRLSLDRAMRLLRDLLLDTDERTRGSALTAVRSLGSAQPRMMLARFERWIEEAELGEIVAAGLAALVHPLGGACVPLMERLSQNRSTRVRWTLATWIGQADLFLDGPNEMMAERIQRLLASLAGDRDHTVRCQLARSLGWADGGSPIGYPGAYPLRALEVLSALWDDDRESVMNAAVFSARVIARCCGRDVSLWAFGQGPRVQRHV